MNTSTEQLLAKALEYLERQIRVRECPAIVALDAPSPLLLSDYDYLRDEQAAEAFERRAAAKARETSANRWVLAVPQVWQIRRDAISVRPVSNLPLRPGEEEAITWIAVDPDEGVDYGRVLITRDPHGTFIFGDTEIIVAAARMAPAMPGHTMLQALISADDTE